MSSSYTSSNNTKFVWVVVVCNANCSNNLIGPRGSVTDISGRWPQTSTAGSNNEHCSSRVLWQENSISYVWRGTRVQQWEFGRLQLKHLEEIWQISLKSIYFSFDRPVLTIIYIVGSKFCSIQVYTTSWQINMQYYIIRDLFLPLCFDWETKVYFGKPISMISMSLTAEKKASSSLYEQD